MKILFLRGSVPPKSEHPEKLLYSSIEECEDMWTQLWYELCLQMNAGGRLYYDKSYENKTIKIDDKRSENWIDSFKNIDYEPDIIFSRGGFPSYVPVFERFPKAYKVYYGAGQRYIPKDNIKYDLNLVDSPRQKDQLVKLEYNAKLLIKPAAKLFKPIDVEKKYDILFVGNGSHRHLKGHELMLQAFKKSKYSILNIGNTDQYLVKLAEKMRVNITWGGWHLRKYLPKLMSQCKVALVCTTDVDSCPRVIPEALACGLPLVVTDNVHFYNEKYINEQTGMLCKRTPRDIHKKVKYVLRNIDNYSIKNINSYYNNYIRIDKSVNEIVKMVGRKIL